MNKGVREQVFCITSMATRLSVVISKYENYEICGFINSPFFQYSVPFRNTLDLLLKMNKMYDTLNFPQASFEYRSFYSKKGRELVPELEDIKMSEISQNESPQAKFIVHVQFRQNATWQGTIQWVDAEKTQHFRSTLEMLRLMEEALDSQQSNAMNSFSE
ncbi:MAG: hypothetical protein ACOX6U_10780 [Oscillospiraceae bacterium]|jgi:hypothetical protein